MSSQMNSLRTKFNDYHLDLGMYCEKRLSAAQRRFTRACETLARVRKLSRNTPALQLNIATSGGQQVNVANGKQMRNLTFRQNRNDLSLFNSLTAQ